MPKGPSGLLPSLGIHRPLLLSCNVIINNFSKILSSDTTGPMKTKLDMNIPQGILPGTDVAIFYLSTNKLLFQSHEK